MSFESFRIELRGGTASIAEADSVVREYPFTHRDTESIGSKTSGFYTVDDGSHIIEIEVANNPVKLSCRFTLCHPSSVDAAFLNLIRDLQSRLAMNAFVCDDIRTEYVHAFSPNEFPEFASVVRETIVKRRAEWVKNFGSMVMPANTPKVYEKFILPRCTPVAG
jgi:hypothetical protein